ncbi:MAG TPA: hypothetical protein PKE36_05485 [Chiayiivirga sp.]|nr:hypothetical protein [Chiayiivirga sp.]
MVRTGLLLLVLAAAWLAEGVARAQPAMDGEIHPLPEGAVLSGVVTDVRLKEISGLAVSRRHPGIVWMHNDSHQPSVLYAVDGHGSVHAALELPVEDLDWEDMASFEHADRAWLLVADTGDNGGLRRELALHVLEEPGRLQDVRMESVRTIRFRWPDGARDCEAVAVDAAEGAIYLVSKKRVPPELFRLPLFPVDAEALQVAEPLGTLAGIVQPSVEDRERNPVYGRYRGQITAADIRADGSAFAVMSYLHLYLWPRHSDGWAVALRQPPVRLDLPWMAQAEGMGFEADGTAVWISSERLPAPLVRYAVPPLGTVVTSEVDARLVK